MQCGPEALVSVRSDKVAWGVLLQRGAASGITGAHPMTVVAPPTQPLRLADPSGSYNIQMTEAVVRV